MQGRESTAGQQPHRWRIWQLGWTVVAAVTLFFCLIVALMIQQEMIWRPYTREYRRIEASILSLRNRQPSNVITDEWNAGVNWTVTAICNVFFSPETASLQSMKLFEEKLNDKLKEEIDLSVFDWIWDQLELTGPKGKQYIRRFRHMFHEHMEGTGKQQTCQVVAELTVVSIAFQGPYHAVSALYAAKSANSNPSAK
jgi:hypothetical protein